jgi:quinohemoprotein ethanol dehydrogenase
MRSRRAAVLVGSLSLAAASLTCAKESHAPGDVTAARLAQADQAPGNWYTLGRDARQDYFSPLTSIDSTNVGRLGFAWAYDLGTTHGQEATPIVVDGVMYTSGYVGIVYALDAVTGKEIWRFDPRVSPRAMRNPCCDVVNRGVAVWQGRVYVAALDGQLYALDAATGKQVWSADTFIDHEQDYTSTGAPIVAHHVVVIGNSGGDLGRGGVRGYVSAYDLASGALRWRFFTVPPAPGKPFEHAELALAEKSWAPRRDAAFRGGATAWDGMTYDPALNRLYFGTGNAAPYDVRKLGPGNGDMLFACSILALDPDNGKMVWYYQTTPGDKWDYDAVQKLVLADLPIDGKLRHVIMQANKNGFFYVLDRETGQLVSAKNFTYVNWASGVDPSTGRPMVTPHAEYYDKPSDIYPSAMGGHTWQPMSFDPLTKLVYIPVVDMPNVLFDLEHNGGRLKYVNGAFTVGMMFPDESYDPGAAKSMFGTLPDLASLRSERPGQKLVRELIRAWDPVAQKTVWEHETSSGVRRQEGGVLSTAGNLVFQGHGDGELVVYAADGGQELKTIATGAHIMAAPITYSVNGTQYVAVQTGYGGSGMTVSSIPQSSAARMYSNENRILVFKLDGGPVPMPALRPAELFPPPPPSTASKAEIDRGEVKFVEQCSRCHVFGPNTTPDLSKLTPALHSAFTDIVLNGALASGGMEKFGDLLSTADVDAIHAYLIDLQRQGYARQQRPPGS